MGLARARLYLVESKWKPPMLHIMVAGNSKFVSILLYIIVIFSYWFADLHVVCATAWCCSILLTCMWFVPLVL